MAEIKEIKKESKKSLPKAKKATKTSKVEPVNNSGFAIIETGGKQYRVSVGDTIQIEKMKEVASASPSSRATAPKEGDPVIFDKVLLIDNGTDSTDVGTPYITGAKVSGTLVEIGRNAKVIVIKYKQKSRYFKKNGHRQPHFKVKIDKIS